MINMIINHVNHVNWHDNKLIMELMNTYISLAVIIFNSNVNGSILAKGSHTAPRIAYLTTGSHTSKQDHIPHNRITYLTTGSHTSQQDYIPHNRITCLTPGSHTSQLGHIPHNRITYLTTGSHTWKQNHIPQHRITYLSTGSHTSAQDHIPQHRIANTSVRISEFPTHSTHPSAGRPLWGLAGRTKCGQLIRRHPFIHYLH